VILYPRRVETGGVMKPRKQEPSGSDDLFRSRLENIINLRHELALLGGQIDWAFFDDAYEAFYSEEGRPGIATRMMVGLHILKHMFNLSDDGVCDRWVYDPYFQHFCGEEYFRFELPIDRSSMSRWRDRIGPDGLEKVFQESLGVAHRTGALRTKDLKRVTVDTTVQEKAIAFPTDAKLMHRARESLVRLAKHNGVPLRQSYPNKLRVYRSGQKRGITPTIKKELRRRSAVEAVIGHLKCDGRLGRNYLKGRDGDKTNAILAGAGYNYRLVLKWLRLLLARIMAAILGACRLPVPAEITHPI